MKKHPIWAHLERSVLSSDRRLRQQTRVPFKRCSVSFAFDTNLYTVRVAVAAGKFWRAVTPNSGKKRHVYECDIFNTCLAFPLLAWSEGYSLLRSFCRA